MQLSAQQKIRFGACAWDFPEWAGTFYPEGLPPERWLEFYARHFPAVEIDIAPGQGLSEEVVRRWAEDTPASFRFSCRLPRAITHACRLHDCRAEFSAFLRALEPIAERLPVVLIQLPPSFSPTEGRAALRHFLEQLPRDFRFAIEFRHAGWHQPSIIRLLTKHRVCWVWADVTSLTERNLAPFEPWPHTTDFIYVRLLGDYTTKYADGGERAHRYGKLLWKREAALDSWAVKIDRHLEEIRNAWVFVNNHFEGYAPETCQRLASRLGYQLPLPEIEVPAVEETGQLDLFARAADADSDRP